MRISRTGRYSLGRDTQTGHAYLSIPVTNRMVNYEEYFRLGPTQFDDFSADYCAARTFADECRRQQHDDLLILPPGSDRGTAD